MRFILKERIFSLRDSYFIRSEAGETVFEVTGRFIGLRDKLILRNQQGELVATVGRKLLALRPVYTIQRAGQPDVKVKKDFINLLRQGFTVDIEGDPSDLRIQGDILNHNYSIQRDGTPVAEVSKKWIALRDSYVIDITEGEDIVLLIATAIVVERIAHNDKQGEDD